MKRPPDPARATPARRALSDRTYAALPTERLLRAARDLDTLSPERVVRLMAREERKSVAAVARAAPAIARAAERAAAALLAGGRLVYVGAGTSGRLAALDAAECPPTFGIAPSQVVAVVAGGPRALRRAVEGAEDDEEQARQALVRLRVGPRDLVVAVAASGVTPFARAALAHARRVGAATVLVTSAPQAAARAGARADVTIGLDVGPEVLAGSTRLKAGTATKMALNALSTAAMIRAGKCYGPYMVDLVATSAKLRARARRILARLGGVPFGRADALLAEAGGRVKTALVMARLAVSRREAERRLADAEGRLRAVLGAPSDGRPSGRTRRARPKNRVP